MQFIIENKDTILSLLIAALFLGLGLLTLKYRKSNKEKTQDLVDNLDAFNNYLHVMQLIGGVIKVDDKVKSQYMKILEVCEIATKYTSNVLKTTDEKQVEEQIRATVEKLLKENNIEPTPEVKQIIEFGIREALRKLQ
ncbi:hypothetical protein [Paenibacillus elgii]|uniref:hypothetical protein n=1 Tax=Paenibacillus elgii TaxID=189691 RepID=UPI000248C656|nr:hypothetical protein [Paenibacillus elgii]